MPLQWAWTIYLNARLSGPPAFVESHAYFPLEGGRLLAYDLITGMQNWGVNAQPKFEPSVGQGLIFIVESDRISARRQQDGALEWQLPWTDELAAAPVWDNEWLVLATKAGVVFALRASDGSVIWKHDVGGRTTTKPALARDHVYVATENALVLAMRIQDGEPLWTRRLGGPATGLLAVDDQIFVGSTDNYFYCLLPESGRVDWRWRAGADPIGQPVVDAKNVYFVALDNILRALSRGHGVQQWVQTLPLRPTRGPLMAGSMLLVTGIAPMLRIYNVKDGKPAGELTTAGEITNDPYHVSAGATGLPGVLVVTRDIAVGAIAAFYTRQVEPTALPLGALPNPVPLPVLPPVPVEPSGTTDPAAGPPSPEPPTPAERPPNERTSN